MTRRRVDTELVRRGLVVSRSEAQAAVRAGRVLIRGTPATKVTTLVAGDDPLVLVGPPARLYVSRGGEKLAAALDAFEVDPSHRDCLDAGASTGGFTDCLLQRGARRVVALDVGHGQLAWELRTDPRVTVLERRNVRDLSPADLPFAPSIVVADLSFISLRLAVGPLVSVATDGAEVVVLVKPQFEAGREQVGGGGVVRDPDVWRAAVTGVAEALRHTGAEPRGVIASPITGPAGNVEFLLHARVAVASAGHADRDVGVGPDVEAAVRTGRELAGR
ncbi:MAG TPA: TlyA family RNA methyltransferase [Actinomycetota bacterium]|nr:TlyA family RNA methyltransferase [Actinomycetota bacterium]